MPRFTNQKPRATTRHHTIRPRCRLSRDRCECWCACFSAPLLVVASLCHHAFRGVLTSANEWVRDDRGQPPGPIGRGFLLISDSEHLIGGFFFRETHFGLSTGNSDMSCH